MKLASPARWSVRWQIAALIILTQVAAHLVTGLTIDYSTRRVGGGEANLIFSLTDPMLMALRMAPQADAPATRAAFAGLAALDDRFSLTERSPMPEAAAMIRSEDRLGTVFEAALPPGWRGRVVIFAADGSGRVFFDNFAVAARLGDGGWLLFKPHRNTLVENVPRVVALLALLLIGLSLMFLSVWAGAALVAPIGALARGVDRFASSVDTPPLHETGPAEVRLATQAFNRMRLRIRKLISDRSQTLAAIGHDMRTPLTRLKLRLELLEQSPALAAVAIDDDIRTLERMIDDALEFLRSENQPLVLVPVDLAVLARTVADDYADRGHNIRFSGPSRHVVLCDHDLIWRILDNVVGNAAKFAPSGEVSLQPAPDGSVLIEVTDDGPGIPFEHRDKVLEPFTRIEAVRAGSAQNAPGFGLGLAIARDLTERHRGALTLSESPTGGLRVSIRLPEQAAGDEGETDHARNR